MIVFFNFFFNFNFFSIFFFFINFKKQQSNFKKHSFIWDFKNSNSIFAFDYNLKYFFFFNFFYINFKKLQNINLKFNDLKKKYFKTVNLNLKLNIQIFIRKKKSIKIYKQYINKRAYLLKHYTIFFENYSSFLLLLTCKFVSNFTDYIFFSHKNMFSTNRKKNSNLFLTKNSILELTYVKNFFFYLYKIYFKTIFVTSLNINKNIILKKSPKKSFFFFFNYFFFLNNKKNYLEIDINTLSIIFLAGSFFIEHLHNIYFSFFSFYFYSILKNKL